MKEQERAEAVVETVRCLKAKLGRIWSSKPIMCVCT
jgi:hypothetical protein